MEIQQYLSERVEPQIKWYNKNSISNKYYYITTRVTLTIIAAIIPALTAFLSDNPVVKVIICILSVLTAILANVNGIFRFKDNWVQFRNMCELLLSEKYLYLSGTGKYKTSTDKDKLFVETVEEYLQNENKHWQDGLNTVKEINAVK